MNKQQIEEKIKEILAKDKSFDGATIKIILKDKQTNKPTS